MSYPPNLSEEEIKAIRTRRRNNTIAMTGIGAAIVVIMFLSENPAMALNFLGIIAVVIVMLFARSFLERKAIARRKAQDEEKQEE